MTMIVAVTGLAGFGASVVLLSLGMQSLPARYGLAVLFAYAAFLILMRLWLEVHHESSGHDRDPADLASDLPVPGGHESQHPVSPFGGGDFGGGGAQAAWDGSSTAPGHLPAPAHSVEMPEIPDVGSDEGCLLVIVVTIVAGGLVSAVWVIYAAPALMAELLLDAALMSGLYRRLRGIQPQSWLRVVVRKTWAPFAVGLLFLVIGGAILQSFVPEADSLGDVLEAIGRK